MREIDTNKYIIAFHYYPVCYVDDLALKHGGHKDPYDLRYFGVEMGECGCFPRDLWKKLGGIDRRFIWANPILDLLFRCYEIGLTLKKPKNIYVQELYERLTLEENDKYNDCDRLVIKYGDYDYRIFSFFWNDVYGEFSKQRRLPVESFDDKDIKTISQSETGEWN
jgi:hypothetical protein